MIDFSVDFVRIGQRAITKQAAIKLAVEVLVKNECIDAAYEKSMFNREKEAKTFLGNGIAIPHGQQKDREMIKKTGIAVIQIPDGVEWGKNEIVKLVIGIAAKSDEHLEILSNLTYLLDEPEVLERLWVTTEPEAIVTALSIKERTTQTSIDPTLGLTHFKKVIIMDKEGLHARPATKLISILSSYKSSVFAKCNGKTSNARSLPALLKLGAKKDSEVSFYAEGPDADEALEALESAIKKGLDSQVDNKKKNALSYNWSPSSQTLEVIGVPASPGIGIAKLFFKTEHEIEVKEEGVGAFKEQEHLSEALDQAKQQLNVLYDSAKRKTGPAEAAIFLTHKAFLEDEDFLTKVQEKIKQGKSAEFSWKETGKEAAEELAGSKDSLVAGRAADLRDVVLRVLNILSGVEQKEVLLPDHPVILVGKDFSPSETAGLDPTRVLGLVTAEGGPTSHTAITARALNIPAIVGIGSEKLKSLLEGKNAILDGLTGKLYLEPSESDLESAKKLVKELQDSFSMVFAKRYEPAVTKDGYRIEVVGNAAKLADADSIVNSGGEGIGLLRSEFLFLDRTTAPTEEEQFEVYSSMAKKLNGLTLIIRTLDIGGDKRAPYISQDVSDGSFLGIRGIRMSLIETEVFETQLRAIYRASSFGNIKIMFPMISSVSELLEAKAVAEKVRLQLKAPKLDIGIMIEVPSAAIMANELAQEADFFSVGTNDLTQYTLAMDRLHPVLAKKADALDPAVLRMVHLAAEASNKNGIPIGVCGGAASDPMGAMILIGLGVQELSISISAIPTVKACIRDHSLQEAAQIAERALLCRSSAEVRTIAKELL